MKDCLHVLCAVYNESANIPKLLQNFRVLCKELEEEFTVKFILVDDGSTDGTYSSIEQHNRELTLNAIRLSHNGGPGVAFSRAFEALSKNLQSNDWVATMEGDNTSNTETLLRMIRRSKESYDVILASPYAYGGGFHGTPWWRLAVSFIANQLTTIVLNLFGLTVTSSFFRLHSAKCIMRLQSIYGNKIIESPGFEWAVEMLFKISLVSSRISEVEMQVDWNLREGASKMKTIRTSIGYFKVFFNSRRWRAIARDFQNKTSK